MNINATLFVQMAVFFVGAWITMKFIWPPLNRAIEERQKKIADGLAAADRGEHALEEAKKEGAFIEEAKAQAQVEADKIIAAARAQAAQEVQSARDALRDQVAQLAVSGASQILGKEVDASAHQQLLDQLKAKL